VLKNLIQANNQAYVLMHKIIGNKIQIGSTHYLISHLPYRPTSILDRLSTKLLDYIRNFRSLNWALGHQDFIGIDFYHLERIEFCLRGGRWYFLKTHINPARATDMSWEMYPEGIYKFLLKLKKYNLPLIILENGLADAKDEKRAWFIKESLKNIHRAIQEGVDVRGYFHWSLLDNFEWDKGFWPRLGLVEVDYKTLERKIRPSALEYAKICKTNELIL
jgi:beta-glucosidase